MRSTFIALALLGFGTIPQAHAGILKGQMASERADLTQVQLRCTPNSCIDQRTGAYTQSHCDYTGCRPMGGVVGRVGPNGYDSAYDGPRYPRYRHRYYRY